jgi:outer membrane protein OmpA-like peptidoglycan-associated protein
MKRTLSVAAALVALPMAAQAQPLQYPGFYVGVEGGVNWMFNTTINAPNAGGIINVYPQTGFAAGGMIGYDFVGPRIEVEGVYRQNNANLRVQPGFGVGGTWFQNSQVSVMGNVFYDFFAGQAFVPYVGAGAGVSFVDGHTAGFVTNSTVFAWQAILGVGYNLSPGLRLNLDGRWFGTTNVNVNNGFASGVTYQNNNISIMASLQYKLGAPPAVAPAPVPVAPAVASFMVFFDWDRSNLSAQALNTIRQAAAAYKSKGSARITATGHTDTSGPEAYNMALSLRRANAVKDALVREGVPANQISAVGVGEKDLLVPTGDGVREPQNRRVVIVLQ